MENESQKTEYIPVTSKQIIVALFTGIFTLAGFVVGVGSYFVIGIIDTGDALRTDIDFNTIEIQLIRQDDRQCAKRQAAINDRLTEHLVVSEDRHDEYATNIATLNAQRIADTYLIRECMRKLP